MIRTESGFAPERMCAACRRRNAKQNLLRIVQQDGAILIDREQKSPARGVYLCKSAECIEKAKKTRALSRAFKRQVDNAVYNEIAEAIGKRQ